MKSKETPPQCCFKPEKCLGMLFPKSSNSSSLLNNFESSLTERLKKLIPLDKDEIITLQWMIIAMESLCDTHNDINNLITDLKLHDLNNMERQQWVDVYMDITLKLLGICNAFSDELNRINLCILGLKGGQCIENLRSTLDTSWRQEIIATNSCIDTSLERLFESSTKIPKIKNHPKEKVLMKALHAVCVLTVYICSVFATALSNSDKGHLHIHVSKQSFWEKAFLDMQSIVNGKIRDAFSSNGTMVLKEFAFVDAKVKKMYLILQDSNDLIQESFKDSIVEFKEEVERLDHGLDELSKKIRNLFSVTSSGRTIIVHG